MSHKIDRHPHLKEVFEEHPCIYLMHVVFLRQHGNQLIAQHKSDNHTGYGHNDRIRQYQAENIPVPPLRRLPHLCGNLPSLLIDIREHGR